MHPGRTLTDILREALTGAAASSTACVFSNPLDTIRVRTQLQQGPGGLPTAPLKAMMIVAEREGALALWRSLPEAIVYNAVLNSMRFSLYSVLTAGALQSEAVTPAVGGFIAGAIAGAIASPLAKARTVAQRESGHAKVARTSTWKALSSNPFAGSASWSLRNGGHTGIIFSCYERFRRDLRVALPWLPATAHSLLASLGASSLSCVAVNPLDVVATRLFAQAAEQSAQPALACSCVGSAHGVLIAPPVYYSSTMDVVVKTVLDEGVVGLWKGLAANIARIVPHTCLTFAIVETIRSRTVRQ